MRLTQKQIDIIKTIVVGLVGEEGVSIRLFGSRVRDDARGGDIDLFIELERSMAEYGIGRSDFVVPLWRQLGQKVDVVLKDPSMRELPIHAVARQYGVFL